MDPIEAIEELARRIDILLASARDADARVAAEAAKSEEWKIKVDALETKVAELELELAAREERIQTAASRVKVLLEKLPAAL